MKKTLLSILALFISIGSIWLACNIGKNTDNGKPLNPEALFTSSKTETRVTVADTKKEPPSDNGDDKDKDKDKEKDDIIELNENSSAITFENIIIFPEPNGLISIQIDAEGHSLPKSKDDGSLSVTIQFIAGGCEL